MGKLIFWIIVVLVALFIARITARAAARAALRNSQSGKQAQSGGRSRKAAARNAPAEHMVRCAHCGIHLPRSEATMIGGNTWCSQEHARLGVKR